MDGRFAGKTGLVLGVANRRSIAWAIARRLAEEGARLAFTFQGERIEKGVRELAESVGSPLVTPCDVRSDEDVERVVAEAGEIFDGGLDLLVHSVAYAAAAPTSSASIGRRSGARSSTIASIVGKPAIERAASVRTGPAEMAFTRVPPSPRSQARYRTHASSAAFATPMTL